MARSRHRGLVKSGFGILQQSNSQLWLEITQNCQDMNFDPNPELSSYIGILEDQAKGILKKNFPEHQVE